jgi:putative spermidine/putrescine transport system ATP-binding protein
MSYGELRNISVSYDKKHLILKDLNLQIQKGSCSPVGTVGMRQDDHPPVMAGLMPNSAGTFVLDGKDMTDVPVHQRGFGVVFQSYALFPT